MRLWEIRQPVSQSGVEALRHALEEARAATAPPAAERVPKHCSTSWLGRGAEANRLCRLAPPFPPRSRGRRDASSVTAKAAGKLHEERRFSGPRGGLFAT